MKIKTLIAAAAMAILAGGSAYAHGSQGLDPKNPDPSVVQAYPVLDENYNFSTFDSDRLTVLGEQDAQEFFKYVYAERLYKGKKPSLTHRAILGDEIGTAHGLKHSLHGTKLVVYSQAFKKAFVALVTNYIVDPS